jgi:hypothetical protein
MTHDQQLVRRGRPANVNLRMLVRKIDRNASVLAQRQLLLAPRLVSTVDWSRSRSFGLEFRKQIRDTLILIRGHHARAQPQRRVTCACVGE